MIQVDFNRFINGMTCKADKCLTIAMEFMHIPASGFLMEIVDILGYDPGKEILFFHFSQRYMGFIWFCHTKEIVKDLFDHLP